MTHPLPSVQHFKARKLFQAFRRSILDFLALPILIGIGFVVLAEVVDWFDNHAGSRAAWTPLRLWLSQYVGDTQAAIGVLSAIAGSLFTVTSVTFSILLLAVQQGATVLNSQIVDHYMRRKANRAWFGFFVGVSLFALITLVQTTHTRQPVFGVTVSTLLGAIALTALVVLIYSTVDQIRPSTVLRTIVQSALKAREVQLTFLRDTAPVEANSMGHPVLAPQAGYLTEVHHTALSRVLSRHPDTTLAFTVSIGDFVSAGASFALLFGRHTTGLIEEVIQTITFAEQRDLASDPNYNLDNIATIGWTAISSAHSDPAVASIVIHSLQQLLHAWATPAARSSLVGAQVFYQDRLFSRTLDAVEELIVASTESRQHQSLALIIHMLSTTLPTMHEAERREAARLTNNLLAVVQECLPTRSLCNATRELMEALRACGEVQKADLAEASLAQLISAQARGRTSASQVGGDSQN